MNTTTAMNLISDSTKPCYLQGENSRRIQTTGMLDLTRGAARLGLRAQVLLDPDVPDTYRESDPMLGSNVIGSILTALARQIAAGGGFVGNEAVEVDLRRREDDAPVEVVLAVSRRRHRGSECVLLSFSEERERQPAQ